MKTTLFNPQVVRASLRLLLMLASGCATRGLPPSHGINNFAKVDDGLYRGARPKEAGILCLRELGIKTIIDLRDEKQGPTEEGMQATLNGITYTNVPMNGLCAPTDEQVRIVLTLIANAVPPVFVHCRYGCDRTGTIIACYRILHDISNKSAQHEADQPYGMSAFEVGMRRYIAAFKKPAITQAERAPEPQRAQMEKAP